MLKGNLIEQGAKQNKNVFVFIPNLVSENLTPEIAENINLYNKMYLLEKHQEIAVLKNILELTAKRFYLISNYSGLYFHCGEHLQNWFFLESQFCPYERYFMKLVSLAMSEDFTAYQLQYQDRRTNSIEIKNFQMKDCGDVGIMFEEMLPYNQLKNFLCGA